MSCTKTDPCKNFTCGNFCLNLLSSFFIPFSDVSWVCDYTEGKTVSVIFVSCKLLSHWLKNNQTGHQVKSGIGWYNISYASKWAAILERIRHISLTIGTTAFPRRIIFSIMKIFIRTYNLHCNKKSRAMGVGGIYLFTCVIYNIIYFRFYKLFSGDGIC